VNFYPRRRRKPEIIIISLIDIFAILLIFTIVTTTFKTEQLAEKIRLPESKSAVVAEQADESLKISVTEKDEIYIGATKVTIDELRTRLADLQKLPRPPRLALAGDRKASFGAIIAVWDALKQAGVTGDLAAFTEQLAKP
jgi:biopolymer transport protein ExbD